MAASRHRLLLCSSSLSSSSSCASFNRRQFASSAFCNTAAGTAVPAFHNTPSAPLNNLLRTIRERIFLPGCLPQNQKKLIRKQKYRDLLNSEPLVVELGSETFHIKPQVPWRDIPNHWASVLEVLHLMEQDSSSWQNFFPLMTGMLRSGKKWSTEQICRIIRIVGEQGTISIILEAVKRADAVGISLQENSTIRELMWACRVHAMRNGWSRDSVATALKSAVQLSELLDEKLYKQDRQLLMDPQNQCDILGVVLELAAARAALHERCSDDEGLVKKFTERLVSNLQLGQPSRIEDRDLTLNQLDTEIMRMIPLRNALLMSEKVLGPGMPDANLARAFRDGVDAPLSNVRQLLHRGPISLKSSRRRSPSWICDSQRFTKRKW